MAWVSGASTPPSGVRFPLSVLNAVGTATELVKYHRDRARVHIVVPDETAIWSGRTICVVDRIILDLVRVTVLDSIFGHRCCSLNLDGSLGHFDLTTFTLCGIRNPKPPYFGSEAAIGRIAKQNELMQGLASDQVLHPACPFDSVRRIPNPNLGPKSKRLGPA
jgi:hypothetical protein